MKKHLSKFLILIPLIFVGGLAFAAYNFVGPTSAPTANNTDGPLIDTSIDQTKDGGLSVNTFSAAENSLLGQNAIFTGPVFGGTPDDPTAPVVIGDATSDLGLSINGSDSITGAYQSDTLKTGGGLDPLCADATGQFYICSKGAPSSTGPILLTPQLTNVEVGVAVVAHLSHWVRDPVTAGIYAEISNGNSITPPPTVGFLDKIKGFYTADAAPADQCSYSSTPLYIGTANINAGAVTSQPIVIDQNCVNDALEFTIGTYTPHTTSDGQTITAPYSN